MHDLRFALRMLRRSPAFTAVAVLSLAIGIGANTAIFSVVDVLMLRRLAVHEPARLVLVNTSNGPTFQYSLFEKLRDAAPDAVDLSAIVRTDRYNVAIGGGAVDSGPVRLSLVSGNYFQTVGVDAAIGRTLSLDDDRGAGRPVAVISDDYWNRRFLRAPDALGRTLAFGDTAYEIIGVAPRGFTGEWVGRPADVWAPVVRQPQVMVELPVGGLQNTGVMALGRLRGASTRARAQAALQIALEQELRAQAGANPSPQRLQEIAKERLALDDGSRGYSLQRNSFGQSLTILMAAVGLVLLVACANTANLLLARSEARRREMAVRVAVGAGRARLVRQLLTESVVLAAIGGALGVLVAQWATSTLAAFVRSGPVTGAAVSLSMDLDVHPDARVLAFTAALCLATGVLFGLAPAFRGSRVALTPALGGRGAGAGPASRGPFSLGRLLVVAQVALSLVLVAGAGLFVRSLRNLTTQELGFDRGHVLLVWALPGQSSGRGAAAADFWRRAQERVEALPGVVSAAASNQGVLNGSDLTGAGSGPSLRVEGEPRLPNGLPGLRSFVMPGFFRTMGIPIVAGREFTENEPVRAVVISRAMAKHYFGDRNPIGRRIWFAEDRTTPTTIVGVAGDFLLGGPREAAHRPGTTYFSYRDAEAPRRLRTMTLAVRTSGDPLVLAPQIRRELQDPALALPVLRIDTPDEQLGDVLVQERMVTTLSSVFGLVSLALACLGLYGVVSYGVARRTNEIGIRLALGATRSGVQRTILGESLALVAMGVAIGVPATLAAGRLLASRLFGIAPADPVTIAVAIATMLAVATAAGWLPARRASRVNPLDALRRE